MFRFMTLIYLDNRHKDSSNLKYTTQHVTTKVYSR